MEVLIIVVAVGETRRFEEEATVGSVHHEDFIIIIIVYEGIELSLVLPPLLYSLLLSSIPSIVMIRVCMFFGRHEGIVSLSNLNKFILRS
jgi:hypothetical protein